MKMSTRLNKILILTTLFFIGTTSFAHTVSYNCNILEVKRAPSEIYRAIYRTPSSKRIRVSFDKGEELSNQISQNIWMRNLPLLGVLNAEIRYQPFHQFYSLRVGTRRNLTIANEIVFVETSYHNFYLLRVTHNGDPLAPSPFDEVQFLKMSCQSIG